MAVLRIDWKPDERKLRQFGAGLLVFAAIVAGLAWWRGRPAAAAAIAAVGALLAVVTLAAPGAGLWIYKGWMCVALVVGTVVSYSALGFIYFAVLTPMGLIGRMLGRDPLGLKPRPAGDSYWLDVAMPGDKSYYERLS